MEGCDKSPCLVLEGGSWRKKNEKNHLFVVHSLKLTAILPLKIGRNPIGNDRIPTIHFQVRAVRFREGRYHKICV